MVNWWLQVDSEGAPADGADSSVESGAEGMATEAVSGEDTPVADDAEAVERLETLIDENLGFSVFRALEQTKAELSDQDRATIHFQQSDLRLIEEILRTEFEEMITEEVGRIESCLDQFLQDMGIQAADIHSVFMTGGTAYVPRIRNLLTQKFGAQKLRQGDAFISVASGLALSSHLFF